MPVCGHCKERISVADIREHFGATPATPPAARSSEREGTSAERGISKKARRERAQQRAQEIIARVEARERRLGTKKSRDKRPEPADYDDTRSRWNKYGESPRPTGRPYKKDY